jgi:ABC-type multidrug transport system fused ATPase/permease subunit
MLVYGIAYRLDDIADCDRVIVMERGRIEESGSPQELLRDARGQFTSLVANLGRDAQQRIRTIAAGSVTQPSK